MSYRELKSEIKAWKRVRLALFPSIKTPPSEAFVSRVMARLEQPKPSLLSWLWEIPALGLGFAALIFIFTYRPVDNATSMETLLINDASETPAVQCILHPDAPPTDDLIGINTEVL